MSDSKVVKGFHKCPRCRRSTSDWRELCGRCYVLNDLEKSFLAYVFIAGMVFGIFVTVVSNWTALMG